MATATVPEERSRSKDQTALAEREIAHRMLEAILNSGLVMDSEYCPTKGDQ